MPDQQDDQLRMNSTTAPLAEVRLKNFKSATSANIELRPLSVVVGMNSSGKSTLLQSILMLAQAIKAGGMSSQFPLNGEYVRLGTFSEVLSFQNTNECPEIEIGFTIAAEHEPAEESKLVRSLREQMGPVEEKQITNSLILWSGHFTEPERKSSGFATLSSFEFSTSKDSGASRQDKISLDVSAILDYVGPRSGYSIVDARFVNWSSGESTAVDVLKLSGGLPFSPQRFITKFELLASDWWDSYSETLSPTIEKYKKENGTKLSEGEVIKPALSAIKRAEADIRLFLDREDRGEQPPHFPATSYFLTSRQAGSVGKSIAFLGEAEFRKRLKKKFRQERWLEDNVLVSVSKQSGSNDPLGSVAAVKRVFIDDLKYLGPLREAPEGSYVAGRTTGGLGSKGEYAAAVLHAHGDEEYLVPLPDGSVSNTTLDNALNLWLAELGLADEAKATDRGRLGIGLTVSPVGSGKDVDLTSVGVGVSQVLPVLLVCLLARRGSVVLMEQPELHLHPAMQLRLADFLLACARSGRQIIIETHSEHLVNRLRLHVAQDETNATSDLVQLLFAEQENGVTSYRTSKINPLGGLSEDWPRGFLDVGSDEAGQLLRQTILRQRQISSKKD